MLDYISWLDQTLDSYKGFDGKKIDKFKIDLPSIPEADPKYSKWLEFALSRKTEAIDISMIYWRKTSVDSLYYLSPLDETLSTMEKSIDSLPCLQYLKELSLSQVKLDSYTYENHNHLKNFISKFLLERLSIESPQNSCGTIDLRGIIKLKHLNISNFSNYTYSIIVLLPFHGE